MTGPGSHGWARDGLFLAPAVARRWRSVAIIAVACAVGGWLWAGHEPAAYRASARVILDGAAPAAAAPAGASLATEVSTQAQLADSHQAVDAIAAAVRLNPDEIARRLVVAPSTTAYQLTVSATGATPAEARTIVAGAETEYATLLDTSGAGSPAALARLDGLRGATQKAIRTLETRYGTNPNAPAVAAQLAVLTQTLTAVTDQEDTLNVAAAVAPSPVQLAERPSAAASTSPRPATTALEGLLGGLVVGVMVIAAFHLRRPKVTGGKAAVDLLGTPLLGQVPARRRGGAGVPSDDLAQVLASILVPTVKTVALIPASPRDVAPDLIVGLATAWTEDHTTVGILDVGDHSAVRDRLEPFARASPPQLPSWAKQASCLVTAPGPSGYVLYLRVSSRQAARPAGLTAILTDLLPTLDLILVLTPPLTQLPITAPPALAADAVICLTSNATPAPVLAETRDTWPALTERIVGIIHDNRRRTRPRSPSHALGRGVRDGYI